MDALKYGISLRVFNVIAEKSVSLDSREEKFHIYM